MNPTDNVNISFDRYVGERKQKLSAHMTGGVPDYAYALDLKIRQSINKVPGIYALFKSIMTYVVPLMKQQINLNSLLVGPNQFPEVYEIARDCAERLNIGIPQVYVQHDAAVINAYAYASDDSAPLICITSAMLERMTLGELRAVIGHECGHIHNNHSIYTVAAEIILNKGLIFGVMTIPGLYQIIGLVTMPMKLLFSAWSRAAEVTSDRAGVICSLDPQDAINVNGKLLYGGALGEHTVNIEELEKQFDMMVSTPIRLLELPQSHPMPVRRIYAEKEFLNSEVLYSWRPDWKKPDMKLYTKEELDQRCEKYLSVTKGKGGRK